MAAMSCYFSPSQLLLSPSSRAKHCMVRKACIISSNKQQREDPPRRSANYHPTIWDHQTIQSIHSPYSLMGKALDSQRQVLKLEIKSLLDESEDPVAQLKLIDSIERLGVAYHFEDEIKNILDRLHVCYCDLEVFKGAYETALAFRLLRQNGYYVSSDVFHKYRDEKGGLRDSLKHDVKSLLSLYEASYLAVKGDQVLEEANEFSVRHLKNLAQDMGFNSENQIRVSLQVPLHWRMRRLEARHHIDLYHSEDGKIPVLLEFAKLDFNFVQSIHQEELKELSKWWTGLDLGNKLIFSRDRLVENYLWATGIVSEPCWSKCRIGLTKLICIFTVVDDIYDIFGFLEELKVFTKTFRSWDPRDMGSLPENFHICYRVLHNFVEEVANDILLDHGCDVMPFIKKEWEILCGSYLIEAEWFHEGYRPSLKEYLNNAWISVGGSLVMVYAYCLLGHTMRDNSLTVLQKGFDLIYWSSLITRINDDLGTSKAEMERGDAPKSIQCHMYDANVSEEASREYIRNLVKLLWKELNQGCMETHLPRNFVNMVRNLARASHCIFQVGDGIGDSSGLTKDRILSLFVNNVNFE